LTTAAHRGESEQIAATDPEVPMSDPSPYEAPSVEELKTTEGLPMDASPHIVPISPPE
jgi:hypothetical protein